ncbi:ATP-binding protein, partial [Shewanella sp.]|uniref:ATP-binding protein n=1 Tax=Shewanella sp. TaxID=50422 RepID=UPI004047987B
DTNDGQVTLSVRNAGDPIPDYAIDKLFDRFYSLPNRKGQKGSGIGLSFVREVAKLHGGGVTIGSESLSNICATLAVPI